MSDTVDLRFSAKPVPQGDGHTSTVRLPPVPGIFKGVFVLFPGTALGIRYQVTDVLARDPEGPLVRVRYAPRTMEEIAILAFNRRQA